DLAEALCHLGSLLLETGLLKRYPGSPPANAGLLLSGVRFRGLELPLHGLGLVGDLKPRLQHRNRLFGLAVQAQRLSQVEEGVRVLGVRSARREGLDRPLA